ncbi:MAG: ComF family protein [Acidobacteria bacterium]|nr:MAG: ComF family protein [Acidobacteriota bacterium]
MAQINSFKDLVAILFAEQLLPAGISIPANVAPIPGGVGNSLIAALLAAPCAVCQAVLDEPLTGCVCQTCWASIRPITPPICDACGDPLPRQPQSLIPNRQSLGQSPIPSPQSPISGLCAQCVRHRPAIERARTIGEYDGVLRDVIHALKYDGRRSLARRLAALMRARGADLLEEADCVVPVPLHWRREYSRGFNQARELACHLGLPVVDALVRRRHTRAQVELAADRRRANVAGAFRLRRGWPREPNIRGIRVLLIDDVSTTGATLESCARALHGCGASEVFALTAARVVSRRLGHF